MDSLNKNNLIDIEKARSGIYGDTPENRRLHRVGQRYGTPAKPEEVPIKKEKKVEEDKAEDPKQKNIGEFVKLFTVDPNREDAPKFIDKMDEEHLNKFIKFCNQNVFNEKLPEEKRKSISAWLKLAEEKQSKGSEEKNGEEDSEEKEAFTKVKFPDIPNSSKVNLKKYLSGKRKASIDEKYKDISSMGDEELKNIHDEAVNNFNKNFDSLKKSQRAEDLYGIMKIKAEMAKRGIESDIKPEDTSKPTKSSSENKDSGEGEEKETFTKVKFSDVPNSGKVNLKKYLSDKRKKVVDEKLKDISKMDTEELQKLHDEMVKKFNDEFDSLKKSQRAEDLYSIMKVKNELAKKNAGGEDTNVEVPKLSEKEVSKDNSEEEPSFLNAYELKQYNLNNSKINGKLSDTFKKMAEKYQNFKDVASEDKKRIDEVLNNIEENSGEVLELYSHCNDNSRKYLNISLIKKGYLPILNGIVYSDYNGENYMHYDMNSYEGYDNGSTFYEQEGKKNYENIPEEQYWSIDDYIGLGYETIREFLQNNSDSSEEDTSDIEDAVKNISDFIDNHVLENDMVLNRRVRISPHLIGNPDFERWFTADIGEVVTDKSFTSFSLKQMSNFGNDLQITLLAKKGQKIANIKNDVGEYEYLTQKDTKYKVISRGFNSVVVEIVD